MSLASRGARYQVRIAVMLMTVIPLLAAVSIALSLFSSSGKSSLANQSLVSVFAFVIALSGYMMPEHDGIWFMKHVNLPEGTKALLLTAVLNKDVIGQLCFTLHCLFWYALFHDERVFTHSF
jgi:cellobiose-specific phosphotransferase system component IIC